MDIKSSGIIISIILMLIGPVKADEKIQVVASFSILTDLIQEIGGDRVSVDTLVGPEQDAHVFNPAPKDAVRIAQSKLVFLNGLGFEGWMERLVKSAASKTKLIIVTSGIKPHSRKYKNGYEDLDPHAWQDVRNIRIYAANITEALIAIDPAGKITYENNFYRYDANLISLDAFIRSSIIAIPSERRKIVTTHDAFGYFEQAYGVSIIAPQGVSTESEASAKDVATIIRQVKSEHIPAIFIENISDPRLAEQIAKESGAKIGGKLYSDALSNENGPAGTYITMMETNIRELTKAMMP